MAITFLFHNLWLGRGRTLTYFLLQTLRYLLPVALFPSWRILSIVLLIAFPLSVASTISYARVKRYFHALRAVNGTTISTVFKVILILYTVEGSLCGLAGQYNIAWKCCGYATIALLSDALYVSARAFRRVLASLTLRAVRYHVHTDFSHDGAWTAMDVARKAMEGGIRTVFVTDHAEDLDSSRYSALQEACHAASMRYGVTVVPGVEYTIISQHVLALRLSSFISPDTASLGAIDDLKRHCSCVIWAHPRLGLRRLLTSISYGCQIVRISTAADGVEWLNLKPGRSLLRNWRHLIVYWAGLYCGGNGATYIGVDAHTDAGWDTANERLKSFQRFTAGLRRLCVRVAGPCEELAAEARFVSSRG
jgi:predicted metal-dependent phosphoesterase TrpH